MRSDHAAIIATALLHPDIDLGFEKENVFFPTRKEEPTSDHFLPYMPKNMSKVIPMDGGGSGDHDGGVGGSKTQGTRSKTSPGSKQKNKKERKNGGGSNGKTRNRRGGNAISPSSSLSSSVQPSAKLAQAPVSSSSAPLLQRDVAQSSKKRTAPQTLTSSPLVGENKSTGNARAFHIWWNFLQESVYKISFDDK